MTKQSPKSLSSSGNSKTKSRQDRAISAPEVAHSEPLVAHTNPVVADRILDANYRAILTINEANVLSSTDRYKIINWLHGVANNLGTDEYRTLLPQWHARMMK